MITKDIGEIGVQAVFNELRTRERSHVEPLMIPLCVTVDLSGSMGKTIPVVGEIVSTLCNELNYVNKRIFELLVVVVYNSRSYVHYFGDILDFDYDEFEKSLPVCGSGMTPLADSYGKAYNILSRLDKVLEEIEYPHTIPIFVSITDAKSNDREMNNANLDKIESIIDQYQKASMESEMLLVEFVPHNAQGILDLNGYRVEIEMSGNTDINKDEIRKRNSDIIGYYMKALKIASSTAAHGDTTIPRKEDGLDSYNNYRSEVILSAFRSLMESRRFNSDN